MAFVESRVTEWNGSTGEFCWENWRKHWRKHWKSFSQKYEFPSSMKLSILYPFPRHWDVWIQCDLWGLCNLMTLTAMGHPSDSSMSLHMIRRCIGVSTTFDLFSYSGCLPGYGFLRQASDLVDWSLSGVDFKSCFASADLRDKIDMLWIVGFFANPPFHEVFCSNICTSR